MPRVPTPMVYTLMPKGRAASDAVIGAMFPELFTPSVIKIMTLLFALLFLILLMALVSPSPIAVPSLTIPVLMSLNKFFSTAWSVVRGH